MAKYESRGTQSKRTWDRMRYGSSDVSELRARLTSNTLLLTVFMRYFVRSLILGLVLNNSSTSQVVVERKLNKLIQEFQDGKHEGSVLSFATVESLAPGEKEIWRAIRKELNDIGISVSAFDANKVFIMAWFLDAIQSGAFEEQNLASDDQSLHLRGGFVTSSDSSPARSTYQQADSQTQIPAIGVHPRGVLTHIEDGIDDLPAEYPKAPVMSGGLIQVPKHTAHQIVKKPARIVSLMSRVLGYDSNFIIACQLGDLDMAESMLSKGAKLNANKHSAMYIAVCREDVPLVMWLIAQGVDVDAVARRERDDHRIGGPPLYHIVNRTTPEATEITRMLLQAGAEVSGTIRPPLWQACMAKNTEAVSLLLEHGAMEAFFLEDDHLRDYNPFEATVSDRDESLLTLLLAGVVMSGGEVGRTEICSKGLYIAVACEWTVGVEIFLDHGMDANARHFGGGLILSYTLDDEYHEMTTLLLSRGAKIESNRLNEGTKQFLLADEASDMHLDLLLAGGLDIESMDDEACTLLDWAIQRGHVATARRLLHHGAKKNQERWKKVLNNNKAPEILHGYERLFDGYYSEEDRLLDIPDTQSTSERAADAERFSQALKKAGPPQRRYMRKQRSYVDLRGQVVYDMQED